MNKDNEMFIKAYLEKQRLQKLISQKDDWTLHKKLSLLNQFLEKKPIIKKELPQQIQIPEQVNNKRRTPYLIDDHVAQIKLNAGEADEFDHLVLKELEISEKAVSPLKEIQKRRELIVNKNQYISNISLLPKILINPQMKFKKEMKTSLDKMLRQNSIVIKNTYLQELEKSKLDSFYKDAKDEESLNKIIMKKKYQTQRKIHQHPFSLIESFRSVNQILIQQAEQEIQTSKLETRRIRRHIHSLSNRIS